MKFDGFFKEFHLDHYFAKNQRLGLCFWTANGFMFFRDEARYGFGKDIKPFIQGLSFGQRWRLWREYKREVQRRAAQIVEEERTYEAPAH